jgi:hypothetical protein
VRNRRTGTGSRMGQPQPQESRSTSEREPIVIGLLAAVGEAAEVAQRLADQLPDLLRERHPDVEWRVEVRTEPLAGPAGVGVDLVQVARERMLTEGWHLCVCLTDLPLHVGRRPVTAHASVTLGVAVVSVPALGPVAMEQRVRAAVLRLVEGVLGSGGDRSRERGGKRRRVEARLEEIASPVGRASVEEGGTVRFVTASVRGNLRLLMGMVRANRPWRLVVGLSRAIVAALGFAVFGLTSPGLWKVMDGTSGLRLLLLSLGAAVGTWVTVIAVHHLWERSPTPAARERVLLINLATTLTIGLGVLTNYLALLVINAVGGVLMLVPNVLEKELHHSVGFGDYVKLALLVTTLALLGGALGAAVESDATVREAAYGYRPDDDGNAGRGG